MSFFVFFFFGFSPGMKAKAEDGEQQTRHTMKVLPYSAARLWLILMSLLDKVR